MAEDLLLSGGGEEAPAEEPGDEAVSEEAPVPEQAEAAPLTVPGEDATPEEWKEFHKALGAPEDIAGYEEAFDTDGVEWNLDLDPIKEAALEAGLNPKQLRTMSDAYLGMIKRQRGNAEEIAADLREEWGREYDANLGLAVQTAQTFGGDELMESLQKSGLGNNLQLIKTFTKIGRSLASEGLIDGKSSGRISKNDALSKAQDIQKSPDYLDPKAPGHRRAVEEVERLYNLAYPEPKSNLSV